MALKNLVFTDISVGEEAVGGLSVRPVLKRRGQRFARAVPESLKHCSQAPVQPGIAQIAS